MKVSSGSFRLHLDSISMSDAESIAENANDYDIAYNIGRWGSFPYPYEKKDALRFIEQSSNDYASGRGFHFAARLNDGNTLVGVCGIRVIDYEDRSCEIGYWLGRRYWGSGYGKEEVKLLLALAFKELKMHRVTAVTFAFNSRSIHLLEAIGFKKEGMKRQSVLHKSGFEDEVLYGILESEYKIGKTKVER